MGVISKSWTTFWAALGLAAASQAPEFSSQYMQRLGGGIEELDSVIRQFDEDANAQGLNREEALIALKESSESFPRLRGVSIEKVINRHDLLVDQRLVMEASDPALRPIYLLGYPDPKILHGTVGDFQPAIPLNPAGAIWGALGAIVMGLFGRVPVSMASWRKRRSAPRITPQPMELTQAVDVQESVEKQKPRKS